MLDTFQEIVIRSVAAGDKIQLLGFGTFEKKVRASRVRRHPGTGELIEIPEATVPVFKPGREFKDAVDR